MGRYIKLEKFTEYYNLTSIEINRQIRILRKYNSNLLGYAILQSVVPCDGRQVHVILFWIVSLVNKKTPILHKITMKVFATSLPIHIHLKHSSWTKVGLLPTSLPQSYTFVPSNLVCSSVRSVTKGLFKFWLPYN